MKLFYYIRRFREIPRREKKLFIVGIFIAFISSLLISFLPIKYYINFISKKPYPLSIRNDVSSIIRSRKTIKRIVRLFPFAKNCFVKVITLKYLLRQNGINSNFIFSLRKSGIRRMQAHVYLILENNFTIFQDPRYVDVFIL